MVEFSCIVYMIDPRTTEEEEQLKRLGVTLQEETNVDTQSKVVKYAFDVSAIKEVRETYVKHEGELVAAVIATFVITEGIIQETPPLIGSWDEFHNKIYEYNKESVKAK